MLLVGFALIFSTEIFQFAHGSDNVECIFWLMD